MGVAPRFSLLRVGVIVVIIAIVVGFIGFMHAPRVTRVKMAFIFPGSITDGDWNEAAYRAMEAFKEKYPDIDIAWVQGVYDPAQIESVIRSYVQQGYNLIVGVGYQFGLPMAKIANETPREVYFLVLATDPRYVGPKVNIADVRTDQSGFISGYVMISLSKSKSVAFIAGMAVPRATRSELGQRKGIEYAGYNPREVYHVYYAGDFHDVVKCKLATLSLIDQLKVDVVKSMGNGCSLGAVSAAKERGAFTLSSGTYHPELYPEGYALYEIWRWEVIYEQWYQDYLSGNLKKGGKMYWLSLENGGIEIIKGNLPSELWNEVQTLISKIVKGEVDTGFRP